MQRQTPRTWKRADTRKGSPYLKEIALLHESGKNSVEIGILKNKDHTTILYHLNKMGIVNRVGRVYERQDPIDLVLALGSKTRIRGPRKPVKISKYDALFEEPVNPGKPYREYLKAAGKDKKQVRAILKEKAKAIALGTDGHITSVSSDVRL